MKSISALVMAMAEYEVGCPKRINHFLKVYSYAKTIGELEGLPHEAQYILEAAAVTHDIGIKPSLEKYGSDDGVHQQIEGPPEAKAMLFSLGFSAAVVERVCYLISRHHTYSGIDGSDYQILVEADFLVNIFEGNVPYKKNIRNNIFKTETGKMLFDQLYCGME